MRPMITPPTNQANLSKLPFDVLVQLLVFVVEAFVFTFQSSFLLDLLSKKKKLKKKKQKRSKQNQMSPHRVQLYFFNQAIHDR